MQEHREDGAEQRAPRPLEAPPVDLEGTSGTAPKTTQRLALEGLAADLASEGAEDSALTWAHVAQRTLRAVQHASPPTSTAGDVMRRRTRLNDALYTAFQLRQHGRPWSRFDRPTLLLAVDDLIEAERVHPAAEPPV